MESSEMENPISVNIRSYYGNCSFHFSLGWMTGIEPAKNMSHNHVRLPVSPHSPYNTRRGVSPFSLLTKLLPLVWVTGLEPVTWCSQSTHSTNWATPRYKIKSPKWFLTQGSLSLFLLCYLFLTLCILWYHIARKPWASLRILRER